MPSRGHEQLREGLRGKSGKVALTAKASGRDLTNVCILRHSTDGSGNKVHVGRALIKKGAKQSPGWCKINPVSDALTHS